MLRIAIVEDEKERQPDMILTRMIQLQAKAEKKAAKKAIK